MSSIHKALSSNTSKKPTKAHVNRQRVLLVSLRGVTYRHRHLVLDLHCLMPHSKKQAKIGLKKSVYELNEAAELHNCNNVIYFESRKHKDLYMWLVKLPNGPSFKFHVQNMSTLEELNFTGNCLKGSRPVLLFDAAFDSTPSLRLAKELMIHAFGVPPKARKLKPFVDHVMTFSVVDGKIWLRNYQIAETEGDEDDMSLVEIGPRAVLTPMVILEGAFCGPKIYENKLFVSPNVVRAQQRQQEAEQARERQAAAVQRKLKKRDQAVGVDPLSNEALFKGRK